MRSCDVVAWADTEHGAVVCLDCTRPGEAEGKDWAAVFADSEWDSFPSCDRCNEAIYGVALTSDGVEYHKDWLYGESGCMPVGAYAELSLIADPLIAALSDCGVRVETVLREDGLGHILVMYLPEGYGCLPGEHAYDGSGECPDCGRAWSPE